MNAVARLREIRTKYAQYTPNHDRRRPGSELGVCHLWRAKVASGSRGETAGLRVLRQWAWPEVIQQNAMLERSAPASEPETPGQDMFELEGLPEPAPPAISHSVPGPDRQAVAASDDTTEEKPSRPTDGGAQEPAARFAALLRSYEEAPPLEVPEEAAPAAATELRQPAWPPPGEQVHVPEPDHPRPGTGRFSATGPAPTCLALLGMLPALYRQKPGRVRGKTAGPPHLGPGRSSSGDLSFGSPTCKPAGGPRDRRAGVADPRRRRLWGPGVLPARPE